jgi:putative CocE/NonD family hydrolase
VSVERDLPMPTRDGVTLRSDVWRPATGGRLPVLLVRTPYDKTQASTINYAHPAWYAAQGYIVVLQDVRGRWASEGEFLPFEHETLDGHDAIEWAASLPGSNGRVGMYGGSYVGATQLLAARGAPSALKAIAPGVTGSQYYEGWTYRQGAFALAVNASWAAELAADQARRAGDETAWRSLSAAATDPWRWYGHLPLDAHPPLAATGYTPYYFDWLRHPTDDEYWRRWSIESDYGSISAPGFHYGGWYDVFARGTVRNFAGLSRAAGRQRLLMGPWEHVAWSRRTGLLDHGPAAAADIDVQQVRWFDRWLRDAGDGVEDPAVRIFLMGRGAWLEESEWPLRGTREVPLFLRSGGRANSVRGDGRLDPEPPGGEPPDVFVYDPLLPTPSLGGHSCCYPDVAPIGPADQVAVESSGRVLVYTGRPLDRDLVVIGPVSLVLHAASDRRDTDFTARLCDVGPEGPSINILEGVVRARHRDPSGPPSDIEPGACYEYRIDLGVVAHSFNAGHRVRLQIASSDFPQWDRNLNTGGQLGREGPVSALVATQVVEHSTDRPSRLLLTVAGG